MLAGHLLPAVLASLDPLRPPPCSAAATSQPVGRASTASRRRAADHPCSLGWPTLPARPSARQPCRSQRAAGLRLAAPPATALLAGVAASTGSSSDQPSNRDQLARLSALGSVRPSTTLSGRSSSTSYLPTTCPTSCSTICQPVDRVDIVLAQLSDHSHRPSAVLAHCPHGSRRPRSQPRPPAPPARRPPWARTRPPRPSHRPPWASSRPAPCSSRAALITESCAVDLLLACVSVARVGSGVACTLRTARRPARHLARRLAQAVLHLDTHAADRAHCNSRFT